MYDYLQRNQAFLVFIKGFIGTSAIEFVHQVPLSIDGLRWFNEIIKTGLQLTIFYITYRKITKPKKPNEKQRNN